MEWKIDHSPSYSILKCKLKPGEKITAEAGSIMLLSGEYKVETRTGGFLKGIARKFLGGESIFLNTIEAENREAEVWLAPAYPGDIVHAKIEGSLIAQDTSYLAHIGNINVGIAWRGLKGLFAEGELVWLKLEGNGEVWLESYGGIDEITLKSGENITIDNMHFVAMDGNIRYEIKKFGGWKSFIFGGEGLVFKVHGPGRVWVQSRILPVLVRQIRKYLK